MSVETGSLPYVDEHSLEIAAPAPRSWEALLRVAEGSFGGESTGRLARPLGCADTEASGPRPLAVGSAFAGFHVVAATEPRELALAGSHRFSRYALVFRLDELGGGRTPSAGRDPGRVPRREGRASTGRW